MQILPMTKNLEFVITEVVENLQLRNHQLGCSRALAKHILPETIEIHAYVSSVGDIFA